MSAKDLFHIPWWRVAPRSNLAMSDRQRRVIVTDEHRLALGAL